MRGNLNESMCGFIYYPVEKKSRTSNKRKYGGRYFY